ncbi:hypothetical protein [Clostridium sp.]|uniref:hypothetical protein n=1 Tax=Clostridium sp. TaxID=1506 RepID=UPI00260CFF8A|nr:hypothetical protein [Clostridium sp.]
MEQCYLFKEDNEYYTFEKDVKSFIDNIHIPKDKVIWCPFDKKESAFVKVLSENGYKVIYSHIDHNQDFFEYEPQEHYDFIISNPPFKGKANIIRRLKELNKPFAMIFGIQCFNSGGFVRELKSIEDLKMIFLVKRMKFHKGVEDPKLPQPTFHSM